MYNRLLDQADELDELGWVAVLAGLLPRTARSLLRGGLPLATRVYLPQRSTRAIEPRDLPITSTQ
jgi:hypothetical protein